ncbi:hypothetical protein [uncultured Bartonella sp.]|uniref:hypothetical protein n=1 Tax=uncultured Bartonella sp. TaxID=104108 RepID=UPI00262994B7|nr:hypothetical protein [uncultured Bartonella sp.]
MYRLIFTTMLCLPLLACNGSKKTCGSKDVLDALHDKLVIGMNFQIGVENYYDGKKATITLEDPRTIGPSGDFIRCSISMTLTHYVDPKTNVRYKEPLTKTVPMPYSFKNIDAMITQINVAK